MVAAGPYGHSSRQATKLETRLTGVKSRLIGHSHIQDTWGIEEVAIDRAQALNELR